MPNRILREAILTSERVASLDWPAEVFYRRLHSIVDDYGRHEAGHQLLRAKCYPLQTDSVRVADIARWMAACQKSGLILVYGVNGKQYLQVCDFGQRTRTDSKCPPPPSSASICAQMSANDGLGGGEGEGEGARKRAREKLTLPDWLPADAWKDWHDYRNSRKGWTRKAKELSLNTLGELREKGHDPTKVICQSIERGWSGLFPLKDGGQSADIGSRPRLKEL